jgi:hypothetical protein
MDNTFFGIVNRYQTNGPEVQIVSEKTVTNEAKPALKEVSAGMDPGLQPTILHKLALKRVDSTSPTLSYELCGHGGIPLC